MSTKQCKEVAGKFKDVLLKYFEGAPDDRKECVRQHTLLPHSGPDMTEWILKNSEKWQAILQGFGWKKPAEKAMKRGLDLVDTALCKKLSGRAQGVLHTRWLRDEHDNISSQWKVIKSWVTRSRGGLDERVVALKQAIGPPPLHPPAAAKRKPQKEQVTQLEDDILEKSEGEAQGPEVEDNLIEIMESSSCDTDDEIAKVEAELAKIDETLGALQDKPIAHQSRTLPSTTEQEDVRDSKSNELSLPSCFNPGKLLPDALSEALHACAADPLQQHKKNWEKADEELTPGVRAGGEISDSSQEEHDQDAIQRPPPRQARTAKKAKHAKAIDVEHPEQETAHEKSDADIQAKREANDRKQLKLKESLPKEAWPSESDKGKGSWTKYDKKSGRIQVNLKGHFYITTPDKHNKLGLQGKRMVSFSNFESAADAWVHAKTLTKWKE